jgi:hypothetical protein
MARIRFVAALIGAVSLGGCGTYVPEIEDFPATRVQEPVLVNAIVTSIHCEIANAIKYVIDQDRRAATYNNGRRSAAWLEHWGAQITLTLTTEEKSTLNPTATWTPISPLTSIFTLAGTATVSSDATRTETMNFYHTVPELYRRAPCAAGVQPPIPTTSLLIQSDLKLRDWLIDQLAPVGTNEVGQPVSSSNVFGQKVLTHEVKFEVVTSGGLNPAWVLTRATVGQNGTLLTGLRDRIHDLLITLGPVDPTQQNGALMAAAANTHLASQIGLAVATSIKGRITP